MAFDAHRYDGLINDGSTDYPLLYVGNDPELVRNTSSVPLRAVRQDTGQNPYEVRPESGDIFAQGDFSYGSGQERYHRPKSDPSKYFTSEGFDISVPGKLTHLNATALATANGAWQMEVFNDFPFVIGNAASANRVYSGNGSFPGTWTSENPHAGEGDQIVRQLATNGTVLFAAIDTNGVHQRTTGGVWSHYQVGGVNLNTGGTAVRVSFLKDRLLVVGQSGSSFALYEVASSATPPVVQALPVGWASGFLFESGPYIYWPAWSPDYSKGRIYHFGLNSAGSAIEAKGSTPMPDGVVPLHGVGYVGATYVVGGTYEASSLNPVIYQAEVNEDGTLELAKLADGLGGVAQAVKSRKESVIFPWVLDGDPKGDRCGIASHNLGRQAFANNLAVSPLPSPNVNVNDLIIYNGRALFSTDNGLYYENLGTPVTTATLITSIADWNNAGSKTWNKIEIQHKPLATGCSVQVFYTLKHPDENTWVSAGTSSTVGSEGATFALTGITSRIFALKLVSTASGSNSPTITGFSVRSDPYVSPGEWKLTRYVRIAYEDRKDGNARAVRKPPVTTRNALMNLLYSYVTLTEDDAVWNVRVEGIREIVPKLGTQPSTGGNPNRDFFILALELQGTKTS